MSVIKPLGIANKTRRNFLLTSSVVGLLGGCGRARFFELAWHEEVALPAGGSVWVYVKTIYEHDKIKKTINTVTEKSDDEVIVTYQIQVVQEYDNVGNPTLVYMYNEIDEKEIQQVIYKYYIYY